MPYLSMQSISKPNAEKFVISASTIFASTKCHSSSVNQMRFGIGRLRFAIKSPSSIGLGFAQNGFQGVPDLHLWDPDAMLANRRSRSGYPCGSQRRCLRHTAKSTAPTSTTGMKSSSKESRSSCFFCCFTGWETISGCVVDCCFDLGWAYSSRGLDWQCPSPLSENPHRFPWKVRSVHS